MLQIFCGGKLARTTELAFDHDAAIRGDDVGDESSHVSTMCCGSQHLTCEGSAGCHCCDLLRGREAFSEGDCVPLRCEVPAGSSVRLRVVALPVVYASSSSSSRRAVPRAAQDSSFAPTVVYDKTIENTMLQGLLEGFEQAAHSTTVIEDLKWVFESGCIDWSLWRG